MPERWTYLAPKPSSSYRQLFVKGRNIRAATLYSLFVDRDDEPGYSIAEIADQYDVPVDAVREAIEYCKSDPTEIREDWEMDEALARENGRIPPHCPTPSR